MNTVPKPSQPSLGVLAGPGARTHITVRSAWTAGLRLGKRKSDRRLSDSSQSPARARSPRATSAPPSKPLGAQVRRSHLNA